MIGELVKSNCDQFRWNIFIRSESQTMEQMHRGTRTTRLLNASSAWWSARYKNAVPPSTVFDTRSSCFNCVSGFIYLSRNQQSRWTSSWFRYFYPCCCWRKWLFQWRHGCCQYKWRRTRGRVHHWTVRWDVRWTRQTRHRHHLHWNTAHSTVHVTALVLASTSRTHSPVITWWHLYWLQHQEHTHLWSRDDTCIGFNIKNSLTCDHVMTPVLASTSRTQPPVITWWHLYWLQHQELNHLWCVQLQPETRCTCHRLRVLPGKYCWNLLLAVTGDCKCK